MLHSNVTRRKDFREDGKSLFNSTNFYESFDESAGYRSEFFVQRPPSSPPPILGNVPLSRRFSAIEWQMAKSAGLYRPYRGVSMEIKRKICILAEESRVRGLERPTIRLIEGATDDNLRLPSPLLARNAFSTSCFYHALCPT